MHPRDVRGRTKGMRHLLALTLSSFLPLAAQERLLVPTDLPARATAAALLAYGLAAPPTPAGLDRLRAAVTTARRCLPPGSAAHARAARLGDTGLDEATLRRRATELRDDLEFTPLMQAELPEGVPGFVAVDEIELREYPSYRMVRADMRGGSMAAFWPLFQHIQRREIAMTTPVQMDRPAEDGEPGSMAFLYGSPDLGPLGHDGRVEVVDQPAVTVLTIGARGYETVDRLDDLRHRLEAWLAANPGYEAAGALRTMGYNSPTVRGDRRYFEVQLPVRRRVMAGGQRR